MVVIAAYPVKDASGKLVGAITAPIDLAVFSPETGGESLPAHSMTRMFDSSGHIITSYPETGRIGERARGVGLTAVAGQTGSAIKLGRDGIERIYAYEPVKLAGWVALAGVPTKLDHALRPPGDDAGRREVGGGGGDHPASDVTVRHFRLRTLRGLRTRFALRGGVRKL